MIPHAKILSAFFLVFYSATFGLPTRPEKSHVYDENRLVSAQQLEFFDRLSDEVAKETGISIDAVLLDDTGERDVAQYASDIADKWQADAGVKGEVLIFVVQKQRRKLVVTKGTASEILDRVSIRKAEQDLLVPSFRMEHYGDGILSLAGWLTFAIGDSTGKKFDIDMQEQPSEEGLTIRGWIFIAAVFGLLIAFGSKGRRFGFFDNMKKLLSVREVENSQWPKIFENTFGDNLISAFISDKCLMEGFDALAKPWTVNFILKDNSSEEVAKILVHGNRARRDNIEFGHFYSPAEIIRTLDTNALEYLHIANRNAPLCGIKPLDGFEPRKEALQSECERKLRNILEQLQKGPAKKVSQKETFEEILFILYGMFFLQTGTYPETHQQVLDLFPSLSEKAPADAIKTILNAF